MFWAAMRADSNFSPLDSTFLFHGISEIYYLEMILMQNTMRYNKTGNRTRKTKICCIYT